MQEGQRADGVANWFISQLPLYCWREQLRVAFCTGWRGTHDTQSVKSSWERRKQLARASRKEKGTPPWTTPTATHTTTAQAARSRAVRHGRRAVRCASRQAVASVLGVCRGSIHACGHVHW